MNESNASRLVESKSFRLPNLSHENQELGLSEPTRVGSLHFQVNSKPLFRAEHTVSLTEQECPFVIPDGRDFIVHLDAPRGRVQFIESFLFLLSIVQVPDARAE